jgi:hypothetical protein
MLEKSPTIDSMSKFISQYIFICIFISAWPLNLSSQVEFLRLNFIRLRVKKNISSNSVVTGNIEKNVNVIYTRSNIVKLLKKKKIKKKIFWGQCSFHWLLHCSLIHNTHFFRKKGITCLKITVHYYYTLYCIFYGYIIWTAPKR